MNCDPLARWYQWLEYAGFGRALERRRLAFLPQISGARKVLMLGEGDGRFLVSFLRVNPDAEVDYVDSSGKMLALARGRTCANNVLALERVHFHRAEAGSWLRSQSPQGYDLICTHFFLDCFTVEQLESLMADIGRLAQKRVCWIVSEFHYPTGWLGHRAGGLFIRMLYLFFRWVTGLQVDCLPDHGSVLRAIGFERVERQSTLGGLLISEWWERP